MSETQVNEATGSSSPSIFGGMTVIVYQTLTSYGLDPDKVFESVGISPNNLNSIDTRISTSLLYKLIHQSEKESGDPYFVFKTANFLQPTNFHAMGLALFSSRSIRKFLLRLQRYHSFLTTSEDWVLQDSDTKPALLILPSNHDYDEYDFEHGILMYGTIIWFKRMIELMYGPHFRAAEITIPGDTLDNELVKRLESYFDCPVRFNAEAMSIVFKPEDMDLLLPTANAALAHQNDEVIMAALSRMAKADVPMQVRLKLMELLPTGEYSKATIARELCFSVRTLHNKLAEVNTSYQELLDQTRRELAEQYLRQDSYSVGDVAFLLGFSDFSNLSRAFKKWTGQTPTDYRTEQLGELENNAS